MASPIARNVQIRSRQIGTNDKRNVRVASVSRYMFTCLLRRLEAQTSLEPRRWAAPRCSCESAQPTVAKSRPDIFPAGRRSGKRYRLKQVCQSIDLESQQ